MVENNPTITAELEDRLGGDAGEVQQLMTDWYEWMLRKGKNPERDKPLTSNTAGNYCERLDQLFRLNIRLNDAENRTSIKADQADQIIKWLDEDTICRRRDGKPYKEGSKRKFANALDKYFTWRADVNPDTDNWSPSITFSQSRYDSADKLNFAERGKIKEVALDYGSLPAYYETDPDKRERINGLIAQRLGKSKDDITSTDWEQADKSNKIGSLIAVALDTGITPIEVAEARVDWYKPKRQIFKIPEEYASKNRPTAKLPVVEDTASVMSKWIQERRHYERYDETNRLWLNEHGNPYNSKNLCRLVRRLCDEAGIPYEDRKIVWYSLRHNMAQSIEEEEDLSEAHDQLRHESFETTKTIYGGTSIESRRATLEEVDRTAKRAATNPDFDPYAENENDQPSQRTRSTASDSTQATRQSGNLIHIDAHIEDSPEARNELIQDILSDGDHLL